MERARLIVLLISSVLWPLEMIIEVLQLVNFLQGLTIRQDCLVLLSWDK